MTDPPNSNPSPKSPGLKRRNGQQAACEPCRKAKLKCDHALPVCSRCRKRRRPGQCIVIASPTARAELPYHNWSVSQSASNLNEELGRATIKASAETSGFLGPTSFAATVQHDDLEDPKAGAEAKPGMAVADPDQIRLGVQVLMALPTEQACHDLLEWYLDTVVVVASHKLTRRLTLKAFWHSYGYLLQGQRNRGDLELIARELLHNGNVSLKQIDDPMEWIESFSGTNTRWEVLGLLFVAFAYAILSGPDHILNAGFGVSNVDRDGLVGEMKKCVERCIELCRGSLNLLVCNLLYWNALLETVLSGDSSLSVWRLHNDAVGTCVAFGLHIYQGTPQITLYTEQMKSIAACIFWLDKDLSTFTGRPPALSHRYYSCPPPLDINDNTLICGGAELDREIQTLDENGWNTQGRVFEATIVRMMLITSLIQEEIMEMFLGNQAQWSSQRQEELKSRTCDTYAKLPRQLQVSKADLIACQDDKLLWRLLMMRFDRLRINFLLERLATEKGGGNKGELFQVAREMLDLVVFFWIQRDRFANLKHDHDFVIICYGIPSIGILCTELLRSKQDTSKVVEPRLPCSEIIQNLSMMIGFLQWVRPSAGNYKLCLRMSRVIRRVMDRLFEPETEGLAALETSDVPPETSEHLTLGGGMDDLDWLTSIDWSGGPFGDLDWLNNMEFEQNHTEE